MTTARLAISCTLITLALLGPRLGLAADWNGDVVSAAREAKRLDKPMLLFIDNMQCHNCVQTKKEVLSDPRVITELRRYYVTVRVTYDKHPELAAAFNLTLSPTLLVLTPHGNEIGRVHGSFDKYQFLAQLARLRASR
ncbi:MAG: thioredoxin family protein [Planctomycetes bacterium]|nr:thioredoxin family protein [Planctomycetota bacterium]